MSIDAKTLLAEAETLRPALLTDRRTLHRNPEAGSMLPHTAAYVKQRLTELGYAPRDMAGGVTADITGTDTGRCVLLRTDMDALRIREATGLEFQSENGAMHACGHDLHTAMLLGAAALLRQHQAELQGTVRLVFQPDEEGFTGAKAMLSAGVLKEAPVPRAALALHVNSGTPSGMEMCIRDRVDTSKKTVCVVSGGNVDVTTLSRVITRGLTYTGRITTITTKLADRAGSLMNLLNVVSGTGANVVRIHHEREDVNSEVNACVVSMVLETRNSEHVQQIKDKLTEKGYSLLEA